MKLPETTTPDESGKSTARSRAGGEVGETSMLAELKRLRAHCLETVARIDAILPEAEEWASPVGKTLPLVVKGRCESITQHAIDRFRERTGSKKCDANVCTRLAARIASADEIELKPKFRVIELIAHGTSARYWRSADIIFVVEGGVIVTIHRGEADRWIPKVGAAEQVGDGNHERHEGKTQNDKPRRGAGE